MSNNNNHGLSSNDGNLSPTLLETARYHLIRYKNEYKLFLYDKNDIKRVNGVLKAYEPGTVFRHGDEAIFRVSSNLLQATVDALKVRETPAALKAELAKCGASNRT